MKKALFLTIMTFTVLLAGCFDSNDSMTEIQCKQSLCTQEHCYIWSSELNRCGTAEALKKEENRMKKIARLAEKNGTTKVVFSKAKQDSLAKVEKKEIAIRREINELKKLADSLHTADSLSGNQLSAEKYLKGKLEAEKQTLDAKYKTLMDSVEVLNLVNHKQITAVQWIEYNKRKKKTRLENLEKKKAKFTKNN